MKIARITLILIFLFSSSGFASTHANNDNSLMAFNNGTIVDSKTNLMWTQKDNGKDFSWVDAVLFAESFSLASFDDWRIPTKEEISSLFREEANTDGLKISQQFQLESIFLYASETKACKAAYADVTNGSFNWILQSRPDFGRVLLVRTYTPRQ